jgi:hypothetical protein
MWDYDRERQAYYYYFTQYELKGGFYVMDDFGNAVSVNRKI